MPYTRLIRTAASGRQDPSVEVWRMPTFAHFEILAVMVDRVQLQQVLINLMLNAIEAVKDSVGEFAVKSELQDGQLQLSVSDKGVGCQSRRWIGYFLRSLPTRRKAPAWGWPSAVPLWSRMAGGCGQAPTTDEVQPFISPHQSRSRIHGPRLPQVSRSSSEYFSVEPAVLSHFVILANCC